jgi:hypothetical protein
MTLMMMMMVMVMMVRVDGRHLKGRALFELPEFCGL